MKRFATILLGWLLLSVGTVYAEAACTVKSGPRTAALIELYTSEGCSSCPPAEEYFTRLLNERDTNAVAIPLALHVSYWDQLGWKDAFAQSIFDARQRTLVANGKGKVVYTPQLFVNGKELRNWDRVLPDVVRDIDENPALAKLTLIWTNAGNRTALIDVTGKTNETGGHHALYLAVSESRLVSHVQRGENSGATLAHDYVVRAWFGPIPLRDGGAKLHQEIRIPADWQYEQLSVIAFIQDMDSGMVLQAVASGRCDQGKAP